MAIPIAQPPRRIHWFGWLVTLTILGGLVFIAYKIYSAPVELFEQFDGTAQQDALSVISRVEFDPQVVINDPQFRALRTYVPQVGVGNIGRPNPFVPF